MSKNPTPRGIVLRTSITIALVLLVLSLLGWLSGYIKTSYPILFVALALLVFGTAYIIQLRALERYLYRQIKVIYKNISSTKSPDNLRSRVDLDSDVLAEVEQEVREWVEDSTKQIDQLKSSERYRKEFLGNVSHELKTPIFSIQGYLDTLIEGGLYDENVNMSYLLKAQTNVERLINIVSDLVNISLLESGRLELNRTDFDINELIAEVMDSLRIYAKEAEINLDFKQGVVRSARVNADRERISQVLINFIANAIRYGSAGGEVLLGIYVMEEHILVEVSDNGIGISEENLPRVFERFFRTDKARTREKGGTGLGLSIAKHIIDAHGNRVHARSTEGVGSTFGFTLDKS